MLLERFRRHLDERGLVPTSGPVLVGYSGGADSTTLLHLLHRAGVDVIAAHLHHGQREEAEMEMRLCEAFCGELGVAFVSGRADVPMIGEQMGIGLEEAGRHARYEFFRQAAFRLGAGAIATAHTRDDHVETVLLNLTRGSGMAGLAGIPERRDSVIRPLLLFTRAETRAYCDEHALWTHDDPANRDISFARARVRHRVIPELRAINPEVDAAVARMAETLDQEHRFLDAMAARALEDAECPLNGELRFMTLDCEVAFHRRLVEAMPSVLFRRAIRLATGAMGQALDHHQTLSVEEGLQHGENGSVTAEGGRVCVEWDADLLHVRDLSPDEPFRFPLTVPGATDAESFGWTLEATPCEASVANRREAMQVTLDLDSVRLPLNFRSLEPGDRIDPLGFEGHRKVSDLLSEAGLTLAARRRLPMICDILGVVWVPGVSVSNRASWQPNSKRGLRLNFRPYESVSP
ncbi:MAG: tRNA lysidine(34) synthetase TilS [Methanoregulaceae archaeon]|nr:tRNA lysidine(34) synthetase TilS [Methanoregulaceae archaeon]